MYDTIQSMRMSMQIAVSMLVAVVLTVISYVVGHHMGWIAEFNMANAFDKVPLLERHYWPLWQLEAAAVLTAYSSTYLSVVQSRSTYPIGLLASVLFALLAYQYGLYGSALTNIYLPMALAYGYFRWGPDGNTRPVRNVQARWVPAYLGVSAATFALVYGVIVYSGFTVPPWDVAILALTILAQFLLDNKKLQAWFVWIAIDVIAIGVYWEGNLKLVAFQYVIFLINAFWGFYMWYRSKQRTDRLQRGINWGTAA